MASTDVPHALGGHVVEPVELAALLAALILLPDAERKRRLDRRLAYRRSEEYV